VDRDSFDGAFSQCYGRVNTPVRRDKRTRAGPFGEDFPVATFLLPRRARGHLMAIYDAARLIGEFDLSAQPFHDLIEANRVDQRVTRYEIFDDPVGYCRLSAVPVGRLVLAVFGAGTPDRLPLADDVATGLQVVEHPQDVGEDAARARNLLAAGDALAALRPAARTGVPGLSVAGAWCATGWPATMEGAVRSGNAAATEALAGTGPVEGAGGLAIGPALLERGAR
jgi:hypothetical protein